VRSLVVAIVLGLAAAGCQGSQAPAPATQAPPVEQVGPRTARLKAEGDALMVQQEYERAAVKYQAALNEAPGDIAIRYALAVALSYLPRREETIEHFRIVMQRGAPGSPEVRAAREWLLSAGALGAAGQTSAAAREGAPPITAAQAAGHGQVFGKLAWRGIDPRDKLVRVRVSLTGDDLHNRDVTLGREFRLGRVYEIRNVPPGAYRLVAEVAGTTMWDVKVDVPADKQTTVDLTEGNSAVAADFDPPATD
jgi:tetratricopeptide (TPR) repeat protein